MKYGDALTPQEWKLGTYTPPQHFTPVLCASDDGLAIDTSGQEYFWVTVNPQKAMALANLSLTLQAKPEAITADHVEVCISAAWYYRKLSRELKDTAAKLEDAEQREQFLQHANALTQGNTRLLALADLLRALVPPQ